MPQNVLASCCNFTGSDVLHIRILAKFYFDLSTTFLNFQYSSRYLVNLMTPHNLHALCYKVPCKLDDSSEFACIML